MAGAAFGVVPEMSFCVARAALGAPQCHFAWQVQHSEHLQGRPQKSGDDWVLWTPAAFAWQVQHLQDLSLILPGRRSTCSISVSFCMAPERSYYGRWLLLRRTSVSFSVAVAALGAPQFHFAWHVQHLEHLSVILRGRCSTWSISVSFCVAGAAFGHSPWGQKLPSHTHHTLSNIQSFSSFSTILPLLPHSSWYPFCFSSLWIVLCSVSLTYSTVGCPKTLLTCRVIWSFNSPFSVQVTLLALRGAPSGHGAAPLTAAGLPTAAEPDAAAFRCWKQLMDFRILVLRNFVILICIRFIFINHSI